MKSGYSFASGTESDNRVQLGCTSVESQIIGGLVCSRGVHLELAECVC